MATKNRARNSKGHFIKGGGKRKSYTATSHALVRTAPKSIVRTRTVHVKAPARRRRKGGGGTSNDTLLKVIAAGAAIGFLTGDKTPIPKVRAFFAETVPGGKTIGPAGTFGVIALGVDKFFYKNKWLRLAGVLGIGYAAVKLGEKGTDIKWLGDPGDGQDQYVADVE